MAWNGSGTLTSSDQEAILEDSLRSFFAGHAWGHSFLEFGIELTPFQNYYYNKL